MNTLRSNFFAICLGASLSVTAGTIIEGRDEGGGSHTIFIDGNKVKIEADDKTYMLIDLEKKSFLGVDPSEQRVVDLSELYKPTTNEKKTEKALDVQLEKLAPQ